MTPIKDCISNYIRFSSSYGNVYDPTIYKYIIKANNKKPTAYREESSHQIKRPT